VISRVDAKNTDVPENIFASFSLTYLVGDRWDKIMAEISDACTETGQRDDRSKLRPLLLLELNRIHVV
jgi:hypothetical protein